MNLTQEILKTVSNYPGGYKMLYSILYERNNTSEASIKSTLSRLKKKGLLSNKNNSWCITQEGKEILLKRNLSITHFKYKKSKTKNIKTMIIMFDIPEKKRKYRDWLRYELINFGFEFIQQSVWSGPTLSKDFILYLQKEKILQYVKLFKVQKSDLI